MKAISIRNPFAHFILCDEKTVECRSWQTNYRGDLLICSSKNPKVKDTMCGYAICVATLADIVPFTKDHLEAACMAEMPQENSYAWVLENVRAIKPFEVKGKLNLFEIDDSLIDVVNDAEMTDEQAQEWFETYIQPCLYTGK